MADALMVTSSFLPGRGGIESYLAELCEAVAPRLAVLAPGHRDGKPIPSDLPYAADGYEGRTMLVPSPSVLQAIVERAAEHGTDKILFGTPWPLGLLGPGLARRGLRYAVIVHGAELILPAALPGISRRLARSMAGADLLLPVSRFTGDKVAALIEGRGLTVPPIELLRARVDLERYRPDVDTGPTRSRLGLSPSDRVVLCFGRLVHRKGVDRLIRALPRIRSAAPDAVIVIAGTGPEERRLHRLARGVEGRVIFAGRVPDEEAPAIYALADVFALPVVDRYRGLEIEGLGVVLLEAAAAETPCVTGRSGGTPEAVVDGTTGYVVDATDERLLADCIARLLVDPALALRMGQAGRTHVRKEFGDALPPGLLAWLG